MLSQVWQYDETLDNWIRVGDMQQSRRDHMVVEVPGSICQTLGFNLPEEFAFLTGDSSSTQITAHMVIASVAATSALLLVRT